MPMSSQSQSNNQQMVIYALIAIAVLLAVIVGFMVYNNMNSGAGTNAATTPPQDAAAQSIASGMPNQAAPVEFDAKTATKLPAGMEPAAALTKYMDDIKNKKWADAFALLPLQTKNSYGSADAYGQQVAGYGISAFKIGKPVTNGNEVQIVSEQDTSQMNITYTWTYTKVGKDWYVKSRQMGGAIQ